MGVEICRVDLFCQPRSPPPASGGSKTAFATSITKLSSLKNNLILYIGLFRAYDSPFARHWFVKWPASAYHKEHHIAKPPKGPESGKQQSKLWIFSGETNKKQSLLQSSKTFRGRIHLFEEDSFRA